MSHEDSNIVKNSNIVEPRRSNWAVLLAGIGVVSMVYGAIMLLSMMMGGTSELITVILLIAGGFQALLFGFLINVFTDIRWYLQKIAKRDS